MSSEYGATRWWEYYAVRYLMPSVAGMVIVNWISSHGDGGLCTLLSLPAGVASDTASLTLLFLYGNLFCYVASYPVLIFHATRVLDFKHDKWPARPFSDGYLSSIALGALALAVTPAPLDWRHWAAFVLVLLFALVQLQRLWLISYPRIGVDGCRDAQGNRGKVNYSYGYSYTLARRRGRSLETETTKATSVSADFDDDEEIQKTRRVVWHKEFIETYRHLREHGNSAFIFLLELGLAALTYSVVTRPGQSPERQLGAVGVLFAIWATTAVFIHLTAQYLERRFSHFDRRLKNTRK